MKIFAIVMAMLAVMLLTADASAQGCSATLYNDSYVLDNLCGAGGTPFADGTVTIEIVWDSDSDGPDWDDPLAPLCDDPPNCEPPNNSNTANINSFPINGTNEGYGDGYFYQWDPAFTSNNTLFSPNIFYLRICVSNPAMYYVSETFSPLAGPSEINLDSWTCFSTGCVGQCPPPPTPTGFVASDNQCGMVHMTWNPYTADSSATEYVDSLIILRGGTRIGKVPRWATQFDDLTGTVNTTYVYGIQARRRCLPSDTALSSQATDEGIARPAPQIPQSVLATENQCGQVGISWTYSSNLGLDSFLVKRGATIVGRLLRLPTPGAMSFTHVTSDTTLALYCVVGKNNTCGEGNEACDNGRSLAVPGINCGATNINATDGNCNSVTVTWMDAAPACGVTGYHVIRYNNDGSGRNQLTTTPILPNVLFYHTSFGTTNTIYRYTVQSLNTCGLGSESAFDTGFWIGPPPQVTGLATTLDAFCDRVTLTWTDVAGETKYRIYRASVLYDSVLADVTTYNDMNAVAGTAYSYIVRSVNTCGEGTASSSVSGRRRNVPAQVTGLSATDSTLCNGVTITWTAITADSVQIRRNSTRVGSVTSGTTFTDTTAVEDAVYNYTAAAYNLCGVGTESTANPGSKKPRPLAVTGLIATDILCTGVNLAWNNVVNEDSFVVFRNGQRIGAVAANILAFADVPAPGTYTYRVLSKNTCGSRDSSNADQGTRVELTGPANVAASTDNCDSINVTWSFVIGADSFIVHRDGERIGWTLAPDTTFADLAVSPGVSYEYAIEAKGFCGSGMSAPVIGTSAGAPPRPTGVAVSNGLCDGIIVTWNDVVHETGYIVRRNGAFLAFVDRDTTYYLDHPPFGAYSYTVQALNECGGSLASSSASGSRLTIPSIEIDTVTASCHLVHISWIASPSAMITYVYRDGVLLDSAAANGSLTYSEDMVGVHNYSVAAGNTCGISANSDTLWVAVAELPQTPQNFSFTDNHCDSLTLHWVNGGGSFGVYRIYKDDSLAAMVVSINSSWTDTAIIIGETHSYKVSAYSDTCGESDISDAIVGGISSADSLASPQVVITLVGQDAVLHWNAISETVDGCRALVAGYLVFYSANASGPYFYHGFTTDTSYVHVRVLQFALGMNYQVFAYAGELGLLRELVPGMEITVAKGMLKKD